jgi:multiple sugar transport system ATP-binding protein
VRLFDKAVDNGIHARVDVVEFQGERQILTIGIAEKMIKAFCSADRDIRPDHSVWISCEPNDIHVFDKESGLAILNGSRA